MLRSKLLDLDEALYNKVGVYSKHILYSAPGNSQVDELVPRLCPGEQSQKYISAGQLLLFRSLVSKLALENVCIGLSVQSHGGFDRASCQAGLVIIVPYAHIDVHHVLCSGVIAIRIFCLFVRKGHLPFVTTHECAAVP